jgi:hypothetical protein
MEEYKHILNIGCVVASILTTASTIHGTNKYSRHLSAEERKAEASELMQLASVKQIAQEKRTLDSELDCRWEECFPDYIFGQIMYLKKLFPGRTPEEVKAIVKENPGAFPPGLRKYGIPFN